MIRLNFLGGFTLGSLKSNIACRFVLGFLLLVPLTVMADNSDLYDTLCAGRRKALYGIYAYHMLHFDSSGAQDASAASALERGSVVSGIAGSLPLYTKRFPINT